MLTNTEVLRTGTCAYSGLAIGAGAAYAMGSAVTIPSCAFAIAPFALKIFEKIFCVMGVGKPTAVILSSVVLLASSAAFLYLAPGIALGALSMPMFAGLGVWIVANTLFNMAFALPEKNQQTI